MALIGNFHDKKRDRLTLHQKIDATVYLQEVDGQKLIQIDTHGRSTREIPDKVSQTIQLDENSAKQLFDTLRTHFGFR